jgi:3-ketosteroid 9alpha-monooxygenase subunit A
VSRFPFAAAPTSWYALAWSDELPVGRPRPIRALGADLVMRRGADGSVEVRDAFVRRWPRAGDPPRRTWPVHEVNGMVFVHHDPDGRAPAFTIPAVAETASWLPVGRLEWTLKSHIQEVVENSVDLAHFELLHDFTQPARLVRFDLDGAGFAVTVAAPKRVFGLAMPTELTIAYHGMGLAVGRVEGPFPFLNLVTNLPIDDEHIRIRFTMFVRAPRIPLVRHAIAAGLRWHVGRDVADEMRVLEHKRYLERPVLAAGDGPVMSVRRWCKQFYQRAELLRSASGE